MALKNIVIKDCKLQNLSTSQSKLDIVVYPMDENGDLEPWANLKVYINDSLAKNLTANEFGELQESILVNNIWDEIMVQIRDASEKVRSKIKVILKDNSNQSTANSATKETSSHFDQAKQEAIAKLKVNPNNIVHLNESQKNDIDIVKYALMQNWSLMQYVWNDVKNNKEIAKIVIKQGKHNFYHISDLLKTDIDFILELLNEFWDNFWLSGYVRNEPRIQKRLSEFSKNQSEFVFLYCQYFSNYDPVFSHNSNLNYKIKQQIDFMMYMHNNNPEYKNQENILNNLRLQLEENSKLIINLNKVKEDMIFLYKKIKKQYPFFVDEEIEKMF